MKIGRALVVLVALSFGTACAQLTASQPPAPASQATASVDPAEPAQESAPAQPGAGRDRRRGGPKGSPAGNDALLRAATAPGANWDSNHDGIFTCDEWKEHVTRLFRLADANHRGIQIPATRRADLRGCGARLFRREP